jgi:hypothetical protein
MVECVLSMHEALVQSPETPPPKMEKVVPTGQMHGAKKHEVTQRDNGLG